MIAKVCKMAEGCKHPWGLFIFGCFYMIVADLGQVETAQSPPLEILEDSSRNSYPVASIPSSQQ